MTKFQSGARDPEALTTSPGGGRAVPEWCGATADTPIPDRVKLRIWEREQGRCYLSGLKINALKDSFQYEHVIPVGLDGSMNRESNIRLALTAPHKEKTKRDRLAINKATRTARKHLGIHKAKSSLSHPKLRRKVDGSVVER